MRILYITSISPPFPVTNGGRQRSNLLFQALSAIGEVDLVVCGGAVTDSDKAEMRKRFGLIGYIKPRRRSEYIPWKLILGLHPKLVHQIAHNFGRRSVDYKPDKKVQSWFDEHVDLSRYDVIVGRYLRSLTKPGLLDRDNVVLDVDDLDTEVYRSRLTVPGLNWLERWVIQNHIRQLDRIVPRQLGRIAHLWVANENDKAKPGLGGAVVLPNIPFSFANTNGSEPFPDQEITHSMLMVGSWSHRPNVVGRDYFLQHIWPGIHEQIPDAQFDIVGGSMTDADKARMARIPGVNPIGFVDDVSEAYRRCAFSVAPIYDGAGTNIKVIESLALGRTCVVTPKAQTGYEHTLRDGEALMVAHNAGDFRDKCVLLLQDPQLRAALAQNGRDVALRHYSFDRFRRVVRMTIEQTTIASDEVVASERTLS